MEKQLKFVWVTNAKPEGIVIAPNRMAPNGKEITHLQKTYVGGMIGLPQGGDDIKAYEQPQEDRSRLLIPAAKGFTAEQLKAWGYVGIYAPAP